MIKVFLGSHKTYCPWKNFKNVDGWDVLEIKPSDFDYPIDCFSPSEIEANETLQVSYICCGGNISDRVYSMFLFEGRESEFFVLNGQTMWFSSLLSELSDSKRGSLMKRVVSNNAKFILFEMMDGSLYEFDVGLVEMRRFFIPHSSQINCVGSGIMSTCWLVQTIDGIIYEKRGYETISNIEFPFPQFRVKQFACCSLDTTQFIVGKQ